MHQLLAYVLPAFALALVGLKLVAALWGAAVQIRCGGDLSVRLRSGEAEVGELVRLIYESNPIDRAIYVDGHARWRLMPVLFRAPVTVSVALVVLLLDDASNEYHHHFCGPGAWLALALGVAAAASSTTHLATAVVRRLMFGAADAHARDIAVKLSLTSGWAVQAEEGQNLGLYFIGLVYLAVAGFAGLYASLDATTAHAFQRGDIAVSWVNWIYLSVATISTVGFGDVHARSVAGQLAVSWEITCGPLLLSWLLAVFATPMRHGVRRRRAAS